MSTILDNLTKPNSSNNPTGTILDDLKSNANPISIQSDIYIPDYKPYIENVRVEDGYEALRKQRAINQSGGEQAWITAKNLVPNVGLGLIESTGLLGDLVFDWDGYKDYSNVITEFAKKNRNPLGGEVYRENPDEVFDMRDPAWWYQHGGGLVESASQFLILGAGVGTGLSKATSAFIKSVNAAQGIAQVGTAATLAYTEAAMTAGDVYKRVIENGGTKEEASEASANVMNIAVPISTLLNITGVGTLFKSAKALNRADELGLGRLSGETLEELAEKRAKHLANLEIQKPQVFQTLLREGILEGSEEEFQLLAERRGEVKGGLVPEESFAESVANSVFSEEGALSGLLGAFGGVAQTGGMNYVPYYKEVDEEGNETGRRISSEERNARNKYINEKKYVENLLSTVKSLTKLTDDLKVAASENKLDDVESIKNQIFQATTLYHLNNDSLDALEATFEEISKKKNDNLGDEIQKQQKVVSEQIAEKSNELSAYKQEGNQEAITQVTSELEQLDAQKKELEAQYTKMNGKSEAVLAGYTDSIEDNDYKDVALKRISQIKTYREKIKEFAKKFHNNSEDTKYNIAGELGRRYAIIDILKDDVNLYNNKYNELETLYNDPILSLQAKEKALTELLANEKNEQWQEELNGVKDQIEALKEVKKYRVYKRNEDKTAELANRYRAIKNRDALLTLAEEDFRELQTQEGIKQYKRRVDTKVNTLLDERKKKRESKKQETDIKYNIVKDLHAAIDQELLTEEQFYELNDIVGQINKGNLGEDIIKRLETIVSANKEAKEYIKKQEELRKQQEGEEIVRERQRKDEELLNQLIEREENSNLIGNKIEEVKDKINKIKEHKNKIEETIAFHEEILEDSLVKIAEEEKVLSKKLDKAILDVKNNNTTRSKNKLENIKNQYKSLLQVSEDIRKRINELTESLYQTEEIQKDLENKLNYYNNLLADDTLKTLSTNELKNRRNDINKKLNSLNKIIENIRKQLQKLLDLLKDITDIILFRNEELEQFKKENKYFISKTSQEEVKKLLDYEKAGIINKPAKELLSNFSKLNKILQQLQNNLLSSLEHGEINEEIFNNKQEELNKLIEKAVDYQNNIRYLDELIDSTLGLENKNKPTPPKPNLPKNTPTLPKPTPSTTSKDKTKNDLKTFDPNEDRPTDEFVPDEKQTGVDLDEFTTKSTDIEVETFKEAYTEDESEDLEKYFNDVLIIEAATSLGISSIKPFDENVKGKRTTSDEISDDYYNIVSTGLIKSGDDITLEVDKEYKGYEALLEKEKQPDSTNMHVPIKIMWKGKKIGYVHDIDYIRENRVVPEIEGIDNIEIQKKILRDIRNSVINNGGKIGGKIKSPSGSTVLSFTSKTEPIPNAVKGIRKVRTRTSEAITNKDLQLAVITPSGLKSRGSEIIASNVDDDFKSEFEGRTVILLPYPNKEGFFAFPLNNQKLNEEDANMLFQVLSSYINKDNDLITQLNKIAGSGFKSLVDFVNLYTRTTNLNAETSNKILLSEKGNPNRRYLSIDADSVTIQQEGKVAEKITKKNFEELKNRLEGFIKELYINVNQKLLGDKAYMIKLEGNTLVQKKVDYNTYIKDNTNTIIKENKIEYDGEIYYTYFDNPNYLFEIDHKPTVEQKQEEVKKDANANNSTLVSSLFNGFDNSVNSKLPKEYDEGELTKLDFQKEVSESDIDSVLNVFAKELSIRFNVPFELITEEKAKSIVNNYNGETAFFDGKKAYLVRDKSNKTSAIHEIFTHPFLLQIEKTNSKLYNNLLNEAKNNKELVNWVDERYKENKDHEYIARAIDLAVQGELNNQKHTGLLSYIKEFFNKLSEYLVTLFNIPTVYSSAISPNITINQLTKFVMYAEGKMNLLPNPNQLEYVFKSINIINNNIDKIKSWEKNKSIKPEDFWNKVQQLGIDKNQLELIKQSEGNNIEEKLLNFAANYSYTVEINTAKEKVKTGIEEVNGSPIRYYSKSEDRYYRYTEELGWISSDENNKNQEVDVQAPEDLEPIEFDKYNIDTFSELETKHYSNLTVPGGTNYTENEIATPAIIPSIKGHAQFATDNGVGWFRSDEIISPEERDKRIKSSWEGIVMDEDGNLISDNRTGKIYEAKKTRRILELQSDLFQKGRERENLVGRNTPPKGNRVKINKEEFELARKNGKEVVYPDSVTTTYSYVYDGFEYETDFEEENFYKIKLNIVDYNYGKENQFLQLLNKDNNWVTFFIKSIIQDSAKKGYEKVLFPSGNTASKVEGHTTLEEFKKQKEDRIKELEKQRIDLEDEAENNTAIDSDGGEYNYIKEFENIDTEIYRLKQELERVETEGFGALKPIYKFYEENVTNILKKNYNVKQIIDEYGNTWNEVEIKSKDLNNIYFQKINANEENYTLIESDENSENLTNLPLSESQVKILDKLGLSKEGFNKLSQEEKDKIRKCYL